MGLFDIFKTNKEKSRFNIDINVSSNGRNVDIPPFQGDYAKAVFLYSNKTGPIQQNGNYCRYLIYECGIKDPSTFHKELINEGFFQEASIEQRLSSFTVKELKEILEKNNLKKTGNKKDIIKYICENLSSESLFSLFSDSSYTLSDKGAKFLEEHDDYIQIHKHKTDWGIDYADYKRVKDKLNAQQNSACSFYDIAWSIANERVLHSNNYGSSEYLLMFKILKEEEKNDKAIKMLLRSFAIDLNIKPYHSIKMYQQCIFNKKDTIENFDTFIAPFYVNQIEKHEEYITSEMVNGIYEKLGVPLITFPKENFTKLIKSILDGKFNPEKTSSTLKNQYAKFLVR